MHFYPRLREVRKERRLTQTDIAALLHITQRQYSLYEIGKREIPFHHLIALSKIYNLSPDYLVGLIPDPRPLYPE